MKFSFIKRFLKKSVFCGLFALFCQNAFSYDGVMAGQKNIKIAKTEFFDIIYAPGSAESAAVLFEHGDKIYRELATLYDLKHTFRLPVVLSDANEDFNAYFSCAPFNHIVMYDTVCDEVLAVSKEEFLNTFRHELTHAITYNLRNSFWYKFDRIFGDTYNPALLTVTMAFAEGAAVATESLAGDGRANSDFSMQLVRQAKAEGVFPKYSEIQGARDVFPGGNVSYLFGGAFCYWLMQTYGTELYARFWYYCVNLKAWTYFTAFKKVYGFSIKKAWSDFYNSVEVPELYTPDNAQNLVKKRSYYTALTASSDSVAFYDYFSKKVLLVRAADFADSSDFDGFGKAKTLYKQNGVSRLNFSADGRFIAESSVSQKYRTPKNQVRIFDTLNKSFFELKEAGLRDAAVFFSGNEYFVCAVRTKASRSALVAYKLNLVQKGKIRSAEKVAEFPFDFETQIFSPDGTSDGLVWFIKKSGLEFSLCSLSLASGECVQYKIPEFDGKTVELRGVLCAADDSIVFSYATGGSFARAGILRKTGSEYAEFYLQQGDVSGGICQPVTLLGNLVYVSEFFGRYAISLCGEQSLQWKSVVVQKAALSVTPLQSGESASAAALTDNSKPFSPFAYTFTGPHGTFLPFSYASSYTVGSLYSLDSTQLFLGATYISALPWTSPIWYVSAGYNPLTNSEGLSVNVNGGTLTELFLYNATATVEFDPDGYKQASGVLGLSSKIPISGINYARISDTGQILEGRQSYSEIPKNAEPKTLQDYIGILRNNAKPIFYAANEATLGFGNIHSSGAGFYDYSGIELSALLKNNFYALQEDFSVNKTFSSVAMDLLLKDATILPFTLEGILFPSEDYVFAFGGQLIFHTFEIQKSTNFLPLFYFNRISLYSAYSGKFAHDVNSWALFEVASYMKNLFTGKYDYSDELELGARFAFTPNIGGLARSDFQVGLNASAKYRFFPEEDQNRFVFDIGFVTAF